MLIHTVPAISEEASGPSYSVLRLCESLRSCQLDVSLATLDWAPTADAPAYIKRFPIGIGPRRLGRSPRMRRWLSQEAVAGRIELIHNHSLWMLPNVYAGGVARRHEIPLVVSPRGTLSEWAMANGSGVKRLFWPLMQRRAIEPAACFHATAKLEHADIRRMGFRQPVAIIPNGVDIPELDSDVSRHGRTLLFLGRIHPKKGLDLLLPAWQAIQTHYPDWRLRIVGPDNQGHLEAARKLAVDLTLKRVEFTGALYGRDKWAAYQGADLFVLPTYSENFGMTVAEALAAGTPAVVSKGAPWEQLPAKAAGWWIEIGVDSLVAALEDALSRSPQALSQMGSNGRRWMRDDYAWPQIGSRMAATYRWLAEGGAAPEWVTTD
jgi:glycosyltransferase involved in cell wall biosynthesis